MTLNVQIPMSEIEALLSSVEGKAEIVNGELVLMSPTGVFPNRAAGRIFAFLLAYELAGNPGYAVTDNTSFIVNLPNRRSFSPDVAYALGDGSGMGFVKGAPIFAIEVRSENDYGRAAELAIATKRADYFAAGTLVVWEVDTIGLDVIRSYRVDAPDEPLIFRRGNIAHAEPALPGWTMKVDDMFPRSRNQEEVKA